MKNQYLSASKTACKIYSTFEENNEIFRIEDKQKFSDCNIYKVFKYSKEHDAFLFYNNIVINKNISQKRTCKALYEAIKDIR